ncbi:MAG: hypothetical protein FJW26_03455 [Acidimicrobiia bacterium]|nr:hypothetical protein [Acidimicrobiia bacterium]
MNPSITRFASRHVALLVSITIVPIIAGLALTFGKDAVAPFSLGRYLLVASEGLYLVEPNGSCSWSYNPPAYRGQGWVEYDDLVYDGWALPNGHFIYSAHRYVREVDRDKRTVWEYRVKGTAEVKTCAPLPDGRVAVLDSQEQAILELEPGSGQVLHRISLPATGSNHTRYNLLRPVPNGNYLVALRDEKRFVELTRDGKMVRAFPVPGLPVMAHRLADGSTLCSGAFGLVRFDAAGKENWSFSVADAAPHFPLIIAAGFVEVPGNRLLVVNSDWHYQKKDDNRVQLFALDFEKQVSWSLPAAAFQNWKRSEVEPRTGFIEHRCMVVQPLPPAAASK